MSGELITRALSAQRRGAFWWTFALVLLTLTALAVWPAMKDMGGLAEMVAGLPEEFLAAFGASDIASPTGYLNGQLYSLMLPLLLSIMAIMHTNALTAGDEDAGRLELLLALPVGRITVYLSRFAAVALVVLGVSAVIDLVVRALSPAVELELSATGLLAATLSCALLALFHGALALALAGLGLRGPVVLAISVGVLLLGYVMFALLPLAESLADLAKVSPWQWALGHDPLANGFAWGGLGLLLAGIVIFTAAALWGIRRRSIRTA